MLDILTVRPSSTIKLKASSPQGCVWWPLLCTLLTWLLSKVSRQSYSEVCRWLLLVWSLISTYRKEVEEQPHMGHKFSQYYEGSWSVTVFHEEAEVADLGVPWSGGECSDFFYNYLLWQLLWGWQDGAAKMVKSAQKITNSSFPSLEHICIKRCRIGYWTATASI